MYHLFCNALVHVMRDTLSRLGFYHVWLEQSVANPKVFLSILKTRLRYIFIQDWKSTLEHSSRAHFYNTICSFNFQYYLDNLNVQSFRVAVSRLRVSFHRLEVEKGRWKTPSVPYNNRLCYICQVLDDEFHFHFECQLLQDLWVNYIKRYYYTRPSMNKLLQLLSNENNTLIRNISVFIKKWLNIKQNTITQNPTNNTIPT